MLPEVGREIYDPVEKKEKKGSGSIIEDISSSQARPPPRPGNAAATEHAFNRIVKLATAQWLIPLKQAGRHR